MEQKKKKGISILLLFGSSWFGFLLILILLIVSVGGGAGSQVGENGGTGAAKNISAECEQYRYLVEFYASKYGIPEFVEVLMAVMMQESGGLYVDVMQSSECGYNTKYPRGKNTITDAEYSIECGVQALKDAMATAGCKHPSQIDKLKLALQGYNYGSGYVSWAIDNYGGYSEENAIEFSVMMAEKMGWERYGDPSYIDHVFQYYNPSAGGGYIPASAKGITNKEALQQLNKLNKTWPKGMDRRREAVILKGASLIGKVVYSQTGRASGLDTTTEEDCSSFVAWAFQKTGFTDVPYWSTTGTYVTASNFKAITESKLIPGDIGLINKQATGNENHVGLYVGKDQNGRAMWLHCTSKASEGCSTVTTGPRISYYSSFQVFYRYTGFRN